MSSLTFVLLRCSRLDTDAVHRLNSVIAEDYGIFESLHSEHVPIGIWFLTGNYLAFSDLVKLIGQAAWHRPQQVQVFSMTEHEDKFIESSLEPVEIFARMISSGSEWVFQEYVKGEQ